MISMKKYLISSLMLGACTLAMAKLPAVSPEAKAKSDEAAGKAAWTSKVDAYQLCQAQGRVAAIYMASAQTAGKETKPTTATPPCANPGSYVAAPAKPIEASGAHSPAATAASPPSSTVPDAVLNPTKKP
jgi:hypothetical protein